MSDNGVRETFFGMTKSRAALIFGGLALIGCNVLSVVLIARVHTNQQRIAEARQALRYTCSTTTVLSDLVGFVIGQDNAALKNKRLRLSADQIVAISKTVAKFDTAKAKLAANGACRDLASKR